MSLCVINLYFSSCFSLSLSPPFHFWDYSPNIAARHSSLKFRGEEDRTSPITAEENQPVETADGRRLPASR